MTCVRGGSALWQRLDPREIAEAHFAQRSYAEEGGRSFAFAPPDPVLAGRMIVRDPESITPSAAADAERLADIALTQRPEQASRCSARLQAIWSMMPTGAPTNFVSARWRSSRPRRHRA